MHLVCSLGLELIEELLRLSLGSQAHCCSVCRAVSESDGLLSGKLVVVYRRIVVDVRGMLTKVDLGVFGESRGE